MQILADKCAPFTGGKHSGGEEEDNSCHNGDTCRGERDAGFGIAGAGIGSF